jgi:hypothetical protein
MKLSVKETIEKFTVDGEFQWGTLSVMQVLAPKCMYEISVIGGNFALTKWDNNWSDETQSYIEPPTSQEIREEYLRQQTIAECLEYFKSE